MLINNTDHEKVTPLSVIILTSISGKQTNTWQANCKPNIAYWMLSEQEQPKILQTTLSIRWFTIPARQKQYPQRTLLIFPEL